MRLVFITLVLFLKLSAQVGLMKLGTLHNQNIDGWLASEQLDGVRAYWDGKQLLSRLGAPIAAPKEWLKDFPDFALDGELFTKRGDYENISIIALAPNPDPIAWQSISYYVFDVPGASGGLLERLDVLEKYILSHRALNKRIKILPQTKVQNRAELDEIFNIVTAGGGEGVVVRHPDAPYTKGRSELVLKYKPFMDAECEVVGIFESMGGKRLERKLPKVGDVITYQYQKIGSNGTPIAAKYLRLRRD